MNLVEHPFDRRRGLGGSELLGRHALDASEFMALGVVQGEIALQVQGTSRASLQSRDHPEISGERGLSFEPQRLHPHGDEGAACARGGGGHRDEMERRVEHRRVQPRLTQSDRKTLRRFQPADRLSIADPRLGDAAKLRTIVQTGGRETRVKLLASNGRRAPVESLPPGPVFRSCSSIPRGRKADVGGRMERPVMRIRRARAVNRDRHFSESIRRRHDLQHAARVFAERDGAHERRVAQHERAALAGKQSARRSEAERDIRRGRNDDPTLHPMVAEPGMALQRQARLERGDRQRQLAAEQGVRLAARRGDTRRRRRALLVPEPLAIEGIGRQGDGRALTARIEALPVHVDAARVESADGLE